MFTARERDHLPASSSAYSAVAARNPAMIIVMITANQMMSVEMTEIIVRAHARGSDS
jgi:hypothetical protein